ncbi:uncharacterized protein LOC108600941 [Drosophila busckii]|uniref:uncharacterized protein LOC108600941 n=1 Tax=Drosophila busckii TaxID=30019 RepID=UPI00083EEAF5|nr:uncharacterized protein LOC108600941 [Drosophila busckii]XP_017844281.1 uncharacterized protein LOC108600941 [Drosophila busckii]
MLTDGFDIFDPFFVGPPNSGHRVEIKIPECPTYPPPVYATWPPPKEHTNKSVSQRSLASRKSVPGPVIYEDAKSQMGEVAISKAINEEMAAAKRIDAGGQSKVTLSKPSTHSIKTLMGVRPQRSASKSSVATHVSNISKRSVRSRISSAKSVASKSPSQQTMRSKAPSELQHSKKNFNLASGASDKASSMTLRSKAGAVSHQQAADKQSRVSIKSKASQYGSKLSMRPVGHNSSSIANNPEMPLQQRADAVRKELLLSIEKSKQLAIQAAELTARLKAGNEYKYNRYDSLIRMSTMNEPNAKFRDDRMALWYKDAVLS